MNVIFAIFIGGGLGAVCRYLMTQLFIIKGRPSYFATFFVNIIGSFLMGITLKMAFVLDSLEAFIALGFLGGFTTFSTLAFDCIVLVGQQKKLTAFIYPLSTLFFAIIAISIGYIFVE